MFAESTLFGLWNEMINWIPVSAEIVPKNIRRDDKFSFSAEPQKIRRRCAA